MMMPGRLACGDDCRSASADWMTRPETGASATRSIRMSPCAHRRVMVKPPMGCAVLLPWPHCRRGQPPRQLGASKSSRTSGISTTAPGSLAPFTKREAQRLGAAVEQATGARVPLANHPLATAVPADQKVRGARCVPADGLRALAMLCGVHLLELSSCRPRW